MISALKSYIRKRGGYLFGPGSVPKGVDVFHDISRYGYGEHIRTVIDVGANVGDFALNVLDRWNVEQLFCIEPSSYNFEILSQRLRAPAVKCLHKAAGKTEGSCELYLGESNMFHSTMQIHGNDAGHENVRMTTIDRLCLEEKVGTIDLLKTDTEGANLEVLRGSMGMLRENRIFLIVCEVGFHDDDPRHSSFTEVWKLLREQGFDLVGFYEQSRFWRWGGLDFANALFINRVLATERLGEPWGNRRHSELNH
jgi:FkbM family methyltransferase